MFLSGELEHADVRKTRGRHAGAARMGNGGSGGHKEVCGVNAQIRGLTTQLVYVRTANISICSGHARG